jgi:hypothetical protein
MRWTQIALHATIANAHPAILLGDRARHLRAACFEVNSIGHRRALLTAGLVAREAVAS